MKTADFDRVFDNIPKYTPIFEVTSVPGWATYDLQKGDIMKWMTAVNYNGSGLMCIRDKRMYNLGVSSLKFVGYLETTPVDQSKVISKQQFGELTAKVVDTPA